MTFNLIQKSVYIDPAATEDRETKMWSHQPDQGFDLTPENTWTSFETESINFAANAWT